MAGNLKFQIIKKKTEHPERVQRFLSETLVINWNDVYKGTEVLVKALDDLFYAEILYYYNRRKVSRLLSSGFRFMLILTTSAGLLSPLISNLDNSLLFLGYPIDRWGYIFLGASAIFFLIDRLLLGSGGHMRFVSAQLKLERELTLFRIEYHKLLATPNLNVADVHAAMLPYVTRFYDVINTETDQWKNELESALKSIKENMPSK